MILEGLPQVGPKIVLEHMCVCVYFIFYGYIFLSTHYTLGDTLASRIHTPVDTYKLMNIAKLPDGACISNAGLLLCICTHVAFPIKQQFGSFSYTYIL